MAPAQLHCGCLWRWHTRRCDIERIGSGLEPHAPGVPNNILLLDIHGRDPCGNGCQQFGGHESLYRLFVQKISRGSMVMRCTSVFFCEYGFRGTARHGYGFDLTVYSNRYLLGWSKRGLYVLRAKPRYLSIRGCSPERGKVQPSCVWSPLRFPLIRQLVRV